MSNFTTAPEPSASAREHALQAALQCIVLETMDYPPQRPFSTDSYLPAHLIELAQEALQPEVRPCAPHPDAAAMRKQACESAAAATPMRRA